MVRLEFHRGASFVGRADLAHGVLLLASGVFLLVDFAAAMHFGAQQGGEGVYT